MTAVGDNAISVRAVGMAASLGLGVVTACAAARAGIVRAAELDYFPVTSPEDGSVIPLSGHPLPEVTRGFEGFARLVRIAQTALADLCQHLPAANWRNRSVGFYLSLPDPRRKYTGGGLLPDEDARKEMAAEYEGAEVNEDLSRRLLAKAASAAGWPGEPRLCSVFYSGQTGVAEALAAAADDLRQERTDLAVVGGVDTLLDAGSLAWLQSLDRLKTPQMPAGVPPGEAGAFLLLDCSDRPALENAPVLATLAGVRFADQPRPMYSGEPPKGDAYEELLLGAADSAGWRDAVASWLITDQNGEPYRAMEWGYAVVRIAGRAKALRHPTLWYPAVSFGDTGAASGAVSMCMAIMAFDRGYAPAPAAAILSAADTGLRSVALVRRVFQNARQLHPF